MWSTPSSLWSPTCGGPSCRSHERFMPRLSRPTSSAELGRGLAGTACTKSSGRPSASLETRNRAAPRVRSRPPRRLPVAGHHSPLRRPLRRPTRPPWVRLPDRGAARLRSKINLQACLAAPLTPLLTPPDHWRASVWGGWVLPLFPPPPSAWAAGDARPLPPRCRVSPPLLLLRCGDVEPHPGPMRVALVNVMSPR